MRSCDRVASEIATGHYERPRDQPTIYEQAGPALSENTGRERWAYVRVSVTEPQDAAYVPKPLSTVPASDAAQLVVAAVGDRLVLYLGAGLSIPSPARGPRGNEVADKLRPILAEALGVTVAELPQPDLESLAARAEAIDASCLAELKHRAADVWAFRNMEPNIGHEIIALLMREGMVRVVSANWDCAVENAGGEVGIVIDGVSRDLDALQLTVDALPLYKVHGCARRPETLVLTRSEVDAPRTWARAKVQEALSGGTVVFVGLGTVGTYVGEPIEDLTRLWLDDATTVRVVDPYGLSEPWKTVLGDRADETWVRMGADAFLDDLARAVVRDALSRVAERARDLHAREAEDWSETMVVGHTAFTDAVGIASADAVMRWWRSKMTTVSGGRRFMSEPAGSVALMAVAQIIGLDGGTVEVTGTDGNLSVRTSRRYLEIVCRPMEHQSDIEPVVRARIERRRRSGHYAAGVAVTAVVHGATGRFPDAAAPVDIAAGGVQDSDVGAGDGDALRLVKAEHALEGRIAA